MVPVSIEVRRSQQPRAVVCSNDEEVLICDEGIRGAGPNGHLTHKANEDTAAVKVVGAEVFEKHLRGSIVAYGGCQCGLSG